MWITACVCVSVCVFVQPNKNKAPKITWTSRRKEHSGIIRPKPNFVLVFFLLKLKSNKWLWIELKAVRKMYWPPFFMSTVSSFGCGTLALPLLLSPAANPIASNPKQIKNIALLLCILQNFCTSWDVRLFVEIKNLSQVCGAEYGTSFIA